MKRKHWIALGLCLIAVTVWAAQVPIYKNQGGTKMTFETGSELEMQSGATLDLQSGVTLGFGASTVTGNLTLDDGSGASPSLIFKDATDETATFSKADSGNLSVTIAAADEVQVLTGSFAVGNGTPGVALDGEDAYIEGTFEVDGTVRFDGAVTANSTITGAGNVTIDDGVTDSPSLILKDATDETATLVKVDGADLTVTTVAGDALRVATGNLRVGNGTADVALDGEDAYVEGTFEVDGATRIDGAIDANSTANISGAITAGSTYAGVGNFSLDDGVTDSPSITLQDATNQTAVFVKVDAADLTLTVPSTESLRVVTGNLRVGNGTADVALDGEDAYVEGTFEVDGATRIDGALTVNSTLVRTAQEYTFNAGGVSGSWASTGTLKYTLAASATAQTLLIPISGLKVGNTITSFKVVAQIESAGTTVTLDADLRKITTVAAANTDASVGAIVQISVTADTAVATAKTALAEVIAANETFYVILTGTTGASTDIEVQGVTVTVTTN